MVILDLPTANVSVIPPSQASAPTIPVEVARGSVGDFDVILMEDDDPYWAAILRGAPAGVDAVRMFGTRSEAVAFARDPNAVAAWLSILLANAELEHNRLVLSVVEGDPQSESRRRVATLSGAMAFYRAGIHARQPRVVNGPICVNGAPLTEVAPDWYTHKDAACEPDCDLEPIPCQERDDCTKVAVSDVAGVGLSCCEHGAQ